jgi:Holliday junction resolvase RusA-like endonuclease
VRTIVEYVERENDLPLLRFYIHNAPHRRQHHRSIAVYRDELVAAAKASNIAIPIKVPIALSILFINPVSPDLDNLLMATMRAMDGTSHAKPTILKDDGLVHCLEKVSKYFPETKK